MDKTSAVNKFAHHDRTRYPASENATFRRKGKGEYADDSALGRIGSTMKSGEAHYQTALYPAIQKRKSLERNHAICAGGANMLEPRPSVFLPAASTTPPLQLTATTRGGGIEMPCPS